MNIFRNPISLLAILLFALASCSSSDQGQKSKKEMRDSAMHRVSSHDVSAVYYSLPSPLEIASIIQSTGVGYNQQILHKAELGVRYSTNKAAAINLGIYGADLSYSIYFNQQQVALRYLECIKSLSTSLDVADVVSDSLLHVLEDNIQNKEMLKKAVSQTFFHSDALLKENSKKPTAMMIATGMWIESIYISTQLSDGNPDSNVQLTKSIIEEGMVFDDLMNMLGAVDANSDIHYVREELQQLKNCYAPIYSELGDTFICNDGFKVDQNSFQKLCAAVESVRNNFTQMF